MPGFSTGFRRLFGRGHLLAPLWVCLPEVFERIKALDDTFGVVKSIDPEDDGGVAGNPVVVCESLPERPRVRRATQSRNLGCIDPHWERADHCPLTVIVDATPGPINGSIVEPDRGTAEKLRTVPLSVESEKIVRKQAVKQSVVVGTDPKGVPRRPRDVPELHEELVLRHL